MTKLMRRPEPEAPPPQRMPSGDGLLPPVHPLAWQVAEVDRLWLIGPAEAMRPLKDVNGGDVAFFDRYPPAYSAAVAICEGVWNANGDNGVIYWDDRGVFVKREGAGLTPGLRPEVRP